MTIPAVIRLERLTRQFSASPLMPIHAPEFSAQGVELWIKRDDLLHPIVSGNKWRKLKYALIHALSLEADTLVSMGGAYSNHLHALAYAGKALGLQTLGLIRGEPAHDLNPTLKDLQQWGMQLRFVSRQDYRQLRLYQQHDAWPERQPGQYWLPEGGAGPLALRGVAEIFDEIPHEFDVILVACGTGSTLAGLIAAAPLQTRLLGVVALKGGGFLTEDVKRWLPDRSAAYPQWDLLLDYHHGGFAKTTPALLTFMADFQARHGMALDPVYTGKLLFAVFDLLQQGYFQPGQRVLVLHTGGLQGARSLEASPEDR